MSVNKIFRRLRRSLVSKATLPLPVKSEYPPAPFIVPKMSKMQARLEIGVTQPATSSQEFQDIYEMYQDQPSDKETLTSGQYGTPRRDSTTLSCSHEIAHGMTQLTDGLPCSQDEQSGDIDLPPLHLNKPDQTWHSVVAAWHIMKFAQRFKLDLVYVIHIHRDHNSKLPISKFNPFPSRSAPFTGQILAAYGLQNISLPLKFSMHIRHLQEDRGEYWYQNDANDSKDLAHGQIYMFRKSRYQLNSYLGQNSSLSHDKESNQQIQRGILFAAYQVDNGGHPILRETAAEFVHFISDIYLTNGLQSLVLDELPLGAECLRITSDLASSDAFFEYI